MGGSHIRVPIWVPIWVPHIGSQQVRQEAAIAAAKIAGREMEWTVADDSDDHGLKRLSATLAGLDFSG